MGDPPLRTRAPIWLAEPTRFAGVGATRARAMLAFVAIVLAATLTALIAPTSTAHPGGNDGPSDLVLYGTIVDGMRHGGGYYAVAADAMRAASYPLHPFLTMRLPTLAVLQAAAPPRLIPLALFALALGTAYAWYHRLRPAVIGATPRTVAAFLIAGGLVAFVQPALAAFHEIWAGLLIALSLALYRRGRWVEPIAIGLAATLIREIAVVYVGVMAVFAWIEGDRRAALGWVAALCVFAAVLAAHAIGVGAVVRPLDARSPGWLGLLGFGHFVRAMAQSTALAIVPLWLAAPFVGLSIVGWSAWRDPLGPRAVAILACYALLLGVFARSDTFYWGLLVAPILLIGLLFVPDGLRDLTIAALDRRRITVTRVLR